MHLLEFSFQNRKAQRSNRISARVGLNRRNWSAKALTYPLAHSPRPQNDRFHALVRLLAFQVCKQTHTFARPPHLFARVYSSRSHLLLLSLALTYALARTYLSACSLPLELKIINCMHIIQLIPYSRYGVPHSTSSSFKAREKEFEEKDRISVFDFDDTL